MKRIDLYSFDVFDTLITRPYTRPVDLFTNLALNVLGAESEVGAWERFAQARINAESRARKRRGSRDDITLAMIYEEFGRSLEFSGTADWVLEREMALELESILPIRTAVKLARELMASGRRVVFLSDMYLPTCVVAEMLKRVGLDVAPESVYVSGDIGFSKHRGRLFDYVADRESVVPRRCFHTGDNWKPDVQRPRERGWQAALFEASALNRFEAASGRQNYWLATRAGGIARAARLGSVHQGEPFISGLAADVVGPFLTAFVAHVLIDARQRGLNTLYFVSRDGQIFLKIASALQAVGLAPDLECRYLYGSRQAWFLSSVTEARREQFEWTMPLGVASSAADVLRRLEVDRSAVAPALERLGLGKTDLDRIRSNAELEAMVDALLASDMATAVLDRAAARRGALIRYLGTQGLFDPGRRYALVDVGWSLQCQSAFRSNLVAAGLPADVFGYYLGVSKGHAELERAGEVSCFISFKGSRLPHRVAADWFFRLASILVIEHVFTVADHPSVAGYADSDEGVVPIFKAGGGDGHFSSFVARMQEEVVSYAGFAGKFFGPELASPAFIEWSLDNVRRFVCEPDAAEVLQVAWLPTNREMTHDPSQTATLASPLTVGDIARMVGHDLLSQNVNHFSRDYAWTDGALAISPASLRLVYRLLRGVGRALARVRNLAKSSVARA